MIEFKVAPRKATMGKMKGKTVYIAVPKGQQKISPEMVLERIVRETSLTEGDARNVIITFRASPSVNEVSRTMRSNTISGEIFC